MKSFDGLSKEVWYLAFITLVNRAGTMIIPFLALYLKDDLGFTKSQIGWIWSAFGLGSVIGSWLGGKLTDSIGYYTVMVTSLIATGFLFISLQLLNGFWPFCIGIFLIMIIADTFRPASFAAINTYSKPENKTRSITLIRLAINLGMAVGPLIAGFIIEYFGYLSVFWIDGITCITAGALIRVILKPKSTNAEIKAKAGINHNRISNVRPYQDSIYLLFLFILFLGGFTFMQIFSTLPLYYAEDQLLSESKIGWLFFLNGMLIVFTEMQVVDFFERKNRSKILIVQISAAIIALSYMVLLFDSWIGIVVIGMILITYGEMLMFPFSNAYAMNWGPTKYTGEYLGWYTMTFSMASVFGPNIGTQLAAAFGFDSTWVVMGASGILAIVLGFVLSKKIDQRKLEMKYQLSDS